MSPQTFHVTVITFLNTACHSKQSNVKLAAKLNFLVQRRFLLWKSMMSCCAQQCCDMLQWNVAIVWPGLEFLRNINIKILSPRQTIATYQLNMSQHEKWSNLSQQYPTCRNTSQNGGQTSTLIRHENRAFKKRCSKFENGGFEFSCGWKTF